MFNPINTTMTAADTDMAQEKIIEIRDDVSLQMTTLSPKYWYLVYFSDFCIETKISQKIRNRNSKFVKFFTRY